MSYQHHYIQEQCFIKNWKYVTGGSMLTVNPPLSCTRWLQQTDQGTKLWRTLDWEGIISPISTTTTLILGDRETETKWILGETRTETALILGEKGTVWGGGEAIS